jgi:glycerol-3-phosphate dehydrogenase
MPPHRWHTERVVGDSRLNPAQRRAHLDRMRREVFDVVVIGGGVTGCGVALDAATRGLSVALIEQRDLGSGTSSRSSKLFHGGLRYLEQRNFTLVGEALAERNLMLGNLCPHLVEPAPFLYPLRHRVWERAYVGAGIALYDAMGSRHGNRLPHHRHLSRRSALQRAPALDPDGLVGAVQYWDVVVDDARHTMTLARTAAAHGAAIATSTRLVSFREEAGQLSGVRAVDLESGAEIDIRARSVIGATGVWTDDVQRLAGDHGSDVTSSKGVHLVVRKESIESTTGLILRTDDSVLFVIPWGEFWIVGTTDTAWRLRRAHPAASRTDIEYLLHWVNTVLAVPLTKDDVVGVYAGLRPLLKGESDSTSQLSREHAVLVSDTGLISVCGGKYTTYRVMASDAVDAAVERLGLGARSSITHQIPLVGAEREAEIGESVRSDPALGDLVGGSRYRRAEVEYAVTHEGALHLDDILTRRTRISIETPDRGTAVAAEVAALVAGPLGWSEAIAHREVKHYLARVAAERDSQTRPDDETADAARMGAPDVRGGIFNS